MIRISQLASSVQPSATLAAGAKAKQMKAAGIKVFDFSLGEPDFPTPAHICQAADEAMAAGHTHYTPVNGIPELKKAICDWYKRYHNFDCTPDMVIVSNGAKHSIHNALSAVLNPGDEVVIPAPYWVSYPDMVLLADGLPVTPNCPASAGYKLTPRQLEAAITPKTRLLLINSPCNPTGAAYTRAEWRGLADVLLQHPRVIVGTDDMYEKIWWGKEAFSSLLTVAPELYDRVVTINGVSKSYAMTGWRLGYCGGPKEIVNAMSTLQGQSTSNACSITQKAAVAALNGDQKPVEAMNVEFKRRHDWFIAALNRLPGISALPCAGAFYAWADCSAAMAAFGIRDDNAFAEMLINDAGVAVVPGSGFGAPGHFRASFATSMAVLEKSIERMQKVLERGPVAKTA